MRDPKLFVISLIVFVAWVVAATGWVRVLAVVWLIYPAIAVRGVVVRRNAKPS